MASRKQAAEVGSSHVAETGTGSRRNGFGGVRKPSASGRAGLSLFQCLKEKVKKKKEIKGNLKNKQANKIPIDTGKSQQVP